MMVMGRAYLLSRILDTALERHKIVPKRPFGRKRALGEPAMQWAGLSEAT
jgi:hypothetical protein